MKSIFSFLVVFLGGGLAYWWAFTVSVPADAESACREASLTAAAIMRSHQNGDSGSNAPEIIETIEPVHGLEALKFSIGSKALAVAGKRDDIHWGLNLDEWDSLEFIAIVGVGCEGALEWRRTGTRAQAWWRKLGQWWNPDTNS